MARVQLRPGPPIIQYLLHSLKFFFKETSFPKTASMPFYIGITVILAGIWVTGVIVGPVTKGSLMIIFGIYAIHKIVEHNAGSSSGSPYGKLSCVRAVFSAAGELPLFAVIAIVFLLTGTMDINGIISYQAAHGPLVLKLPFAALMFFTLIVTKSPSLMASLSPSDVIAEPASMEFTPISSNFVAILNFFIEFSEIPGVCSPRQYCTKTTIPRSWTWCKGRWRSYKRKLGCL